MCPKSFHGSTAIVLTKTLKQIQWNPNDPTLLLDQLSQDQHMTQDEEWSQDHHMTQDEEWSQDQHMTQDEEWSQDHHMTQDEEWSQDHHMTQDEQGRHGQVSNHQSITQLHFT